LEVPDGREQLANLNFEGGSYLYEVQRSSVSFPTLNPSIICELLGIFVLWL
jgi:hypothetical protein